MKHFKAGTLVRVSLEYCNKKVAGKVGRILEEDSHPFIEFKDNIEGHNCEGLCEDGYGWAVNSLYLRAFNIQLENK